MKNKLILITFSIFALSFSLSAQSCCKDKTSSCKEKKAEAKTISKMTSNEVATFKVYGNCGMCKQTIENAAKKVATVKSAEWNQETGQMTVAFNAKKVNLTDIKQEIANAGYDSDSHRAKDEVYSNLHGCCKYDRPTN